MVLGFLGHLTNAHYSLHHQLAGHLHVVIGLVTMYVQPVI